MMPALEVSAVVFLMISCQGSTGQIRFCNQLIEVGDIGVMVFAMMKIQALGADMGCQSIVGVWKVGSGNSYFLLLVMNLHSQGYAHGFGCPHLP